MSMSQSLKKKAKIPFIFFIFLQTLQADTKNLQILQTDFSVPLADCGVAAD